MEQNNAEKKNVIVDSNSTKLASQKSWTLKMAIRQLEPFQVRELFSSHYLLHSPACNREKTKLQIWDWLFRSCELNGGLLLGEGLISVADIEECIIKGKCKKLSIKLPAWCILQSLLQSAKSNSHGLLICMSFYCLKLFLFSVNRFF